MTALLAVLLALALLIVLAYRGLSVLIAAPLAAALAAGLSWAPVMASLTQVMMPAWAALSCSSCSCSSWARSSAS